METFQVDSMHRGMHLRAISESYFSKFIKNQFIMVSNVSAYAENNFDKISDRLGTLKGQL